MQVTPRMRGRVGWTFGAAETGRGKPLVRRLSSVLVRVAAYPPNRDCTELTACSMLWIVLLPLCKPLSSLASRFANSTAGSEKQDHVLATYLLHETSFIPLSHTIIDRFPIELSTAMPPLRVQTADRLAVRCHLLVGAFEPRQRVRYQSVAQVVGGCSVKDMRHLFMATGCVSDEGVPEGG